MFSSLEASVEAGAGAGVGVVEFRRRVIILPDVHSRPLKRGRRDRGRSMVYSGDGAHEAMGKSPEELPMRAFDSYATAIARTGRIQSRQHSAGGNSARYRTESFFELRQPKRGAGSCNAS